MVVDTELLSGQGDTGPAETEASAGASDTTLANKDTETKVEPGQKEATSTDAEVGDLLTGKVESDETDKSNVDATKDGDKQKDGKEPEKQPIEYTDFTVPEGVQANPELVGEFKEIAGDMGLTQEQAQKLVDLQIKNVRAQADAWLAQQKAGVEELRSDKDFGGERFLTTVREANQTLTTFDTDGKALAKLRMVGLASDPDVVRMLSRMRQAVGEDIIITGKGDRSKKQIPLSERLWSDKDMGGK